MSVSVIADNKDCKAIYEGLISGDPKFRTYRALYQRIYGKYVTEAKKKEGLLHGQENDKSAVNAAMGGTKPDQAE